MKTAFAALVLSALASLARADTTFQSGPGRVTLIELYSSEGCSSCPPAEKWLGELRQDAGLWTKFVPVAFHVNYWDRLGWRDVFASKTFTDREYAYADSWRASNVYTPCFVRNGAEWRPAKDIAESGAEVGRLTVSYVPNGKCAVTYIPAVRERAAKLDVSLALLGSGIVSKVKAGENSGRELHHDFITLALETVAMQRANDGTFTATLPAPIRPEFSPARHAVAAWVTPHGELTPLQATGGWIE